MSELKPFELVNIIKKYGLEMPRVAYRKSSEISIFIEGKINDSIEYEYDIKNEVLTLIGDIPVELQSCFRKVDLVSTKLNDEISYGLINMLGSVDYRKDTYYESVCEQLMTLDSNNRTFMLGIKSKIEFMKALEVILNNCVYDTLEDRNIERKYLLYILTREEFKVGASIDEWINNYNKKKMEYINGSTLLLPVPLEGKTNRLSVSQLKEALDGFERAVNFFNGASCDDVSAILNKNDTFKFCSSYTNFPTNELMPFEFCMELDKGQSIGFKRYDAYMFGVIYADDYGKECLKYDNFSISISFGIKNNIKVINFSEIDKYSNDYIEEITKKINEVSCCIKRELRDKKGHEKKLVN